LIIPGPSLGPSKVKVTFKSRKKKQFLLLERQGWDGERR